MALVVAVLMLTCNLPFASLAADAAGITVSSNVSSSDIDIDSGIEFTYYVEINGQPFNGTATGNDSNTYVISDGKLTMPYDVSAVLNDVPEGAMYSIKRMEYDNDKYALLTETEPQTGEFSSKEYYVSVNGGEKTKITSDEFKTATDNGKNLTVTAYVDSDGKEYDESEISSVTAYDAVRQQGVSTTYSLEQKDYHYVTSSFDEYNITYNIDKSYSETKVFSRVIAYNFNADVTIGIEGYELPEDVEKTDQASGSNPTKANARNTCVEGC